VMLTVIVYASRWVPRFIYFWFQKLNNFAKETIFSRPNSQNSKLYIVNFLLHQVTMLKGVNLALKRFASRPSLEQGVSIPNRPLKKIQIGKARPAIYYKFDCQVELSDGSVITRKSQYPKVEMRMISDQRNSPFWNSSRKDLVSGDTGTRGRLNKFKQRYSGFADNSQEDTVQGTQSENDFLDLIGSNHVEQKLGGNIASKKRNSKK